MTAERERELRAQVEDAPTISVDEFRRRSRRSFLTGAVGVTGAVVGWRWLQNQPAEGGIPQPLRNQLERNETVWSNLSESRSAPEFPVSKATPIQVNGRIGIRNEIDLAAWTVRVEGPDGELLDEVDIATFEALPQRDMVIEHKCIEGWSTIVHWGGDPLQRLPPAIRRPGRRRAVREPRNPRRALLRGMGHRRRSLHPQTMLVLREGDQPLDQDHGAPLRIASPNKYGIKCLKRIGVIRYARERPADYWAERSYDWYAGL